VSHNGLGPKYFFLREEFSSKEEKREKLLAKKIKINKKENEQCRTVPMFLETRDSWALKERPGIPRRLKKVVFLGEESP